LIIERVGQTWLPIGRPSGAAERFEALAARKPAAPEEITAFSTNFRLDIGVMLSISCLFILAWRRGSTLR
jgi:hypothetical protein